VVSAVVVGRTLVVVDRNQAAEEAHTDHMQVPMEEGTSLVEEAE
jgi:hypothetical protein